MNRSAARKVLSLTDPPVSGYMYYSYPLAITFSGLKAFPWFYGNYIQLQCSPRQLKLPGRAEVFFTEGTWLFNPFLRDSHQHAKSCLDIGAGALNEFVMSAIDAGYFVETFVDEYFIPVLRMGGSLHFTHRLLVYGYDGMQREYHIVGYDRAGIYRRLRCSFDAFTAAFFESDPKAWETTKLLIARDPQGVHGVLDLLRLGRTLDDYLRGRNSILDADLQRDGRDWSDAKYGCAVYDFLSDYLLQVIEEGGEQPLDIRGFHILSEHKRVMQNRIEWLVNRASLPHDRSLERYREVMASVASIRTRILVAQHMPASRLPQLEKVVPVLQDVRSRELVILGEMLECLREVQARGDLPNKLSAL